MAKAFDVPKKIEAIAKEISLILKNKLNKTYYQYDIVEDRVMAAIELENRECFGNQIRFSMNPEDFTSMDFNEIAKSVLFQALIDANLPRADRLERAKIWGIKG